MSSTRYDAIIAGAGPAGATAARVLARSGRSVLLLDRASFPRPKACGAGLTGGVRNLLDFNLEEVVEARVSRTHCVFRGRYSILLEPKGLDVAMVRREPFDALLVRKAVEAGAILMENRTVRAVAPNSVGLEVHASGEIFHGGVVIGAEGALSPTGRSAGLRPNARLGIAMDAEVEMAPGVATKWNETAIFDFGVVPRGYGWIFPKRNAFSIGVGTIDARFPHARRHLDLLVERNPFLNGGRRSMRIRSAPLPFWTAHEPPARDRIFLAGDAAGLVDPLSGEGISYAIRSGALAARFAAERLDGATTAAQGYDEEISRQFARGFRLAHRLASLFFAHPTLCYALGVRSQRVNDLFARLIAGEIDYVALHDAIARSLPGRTYRLLKPFLGRAA